LFCRELTACVTGPVQGRFVLFPTMALQHALDSMANGASPIGH